MAAKKKYYVVWEGHNPGIYKTWGQCKQEIEGYPGAKYKSYTSEEEADAAYYSPYQDHIGQNKAAKSKAKTINHKGVQPGCFSVDAACSGNPGKMEYRGVWVDTEEEVFRIGPLVHGTNNVGEFLGLVHALALFTKNGQGDIPIYTDSRTGMAWVRNKKAKTQLKKLPQNRKIFELISRAENWLKSNTYSNPILKWETKIWGEIPADFGRK